MTLMTTVLVGVGAAGGSMGRHAIGVFVTKATKSEFPWGTWVINVVGTFMLGVFFKQFDSIHHHAQLWALLGTGFCGGFTTFSTMSVESVRLFKSKRLLGFIYVGSSLAVGLAVAWLAEHL